MSIPLDRLYHYIESIAREACEDNVIIYRFFPHGSKNIDNLTGLRPWSLIERFTSPQIYCNDQEPLNYKYYHENLTPISSQFAKILDKYKMSCFYNMRNLSNIFDQCLLLHSEQRSYNLDQYSSSQFIPVYYWSHAIIARDWFRYANHVTQKKNVKQTFLIYNRAWSGTREYRLGFADRLIILGLVNHTLMRVSPVDPTVDKHYDLYHFEHPEWRPHNVIENYFPLCEADSHSSADFDQKDYKSTDIEVVLETLFDDLRLHLTEKTLRPIAMGQPFILAGTYGSLKYLREYGFKTFSDCWDESYDMMSDSVERMNKITEVMKNIAGMTQLNQKNMLAKARAIAAYNKQHFFSEKFYFKIKTELLDNLTNGITELYKTNTSRRWLETRKQMSNIFEIKNIITGNVENPDNNLSIKNNKISYTRKEIAEVVSKARKYYLRSLKQTT
jgi:hypothetical protein